MIKYADCRQFVHFVAFFFFQTLFTLFISIKKHTFGNDTVASPALVKKKKKTKDGLKVSTVAFGSTIGSPFK